MISDVVARLWKQHFSGSPTVLGSSAGRVNLIGEHTDYNKGFVFPAAIDRRTYALVRACPGPSHLISGQAGDGEPFQIPEGKAKGWSKYAAGCAAALQDAGAMNLPNIEGVVWSDVPNGSGLSSSAALELALLAAWNELAKLSLSNEELAKIAWKAETQYVGVQCGIMDQMASALGEDGRAIFIDTLTEEFELVSMPEGISIAVLDTRKPRSLASSAYNKRVRECAAAVEGISKAVHPIDSLREATPEMLEAAKPALDDVAYRRARHVITENQRAFDFRTALEKRDLPALKQLAADSHNSLRYDYEVSCAELDAMVRAASAAPGCLAVRLTGAGFGGCCVALVESAAYPQFEASTLASYAMYGFPSPKLFQTKASSGASVIEISSEKI